MLELKDKQKRWLDYELDGKPSRMPSVVARELANREEARIDGDKLFVSNMVFDAKDFEVEQ